jgi:hypothetical protein
MTIPFDTRFLKTEYASAYLKLEEASGVSDEPDDVVVAALGDVLAVDGDHVVAGVQHGARCRTVGHNVAQDARALGPMLWYGNTY